MSDGRIGGSDLQGAFRELDPPPGGRAALRRRLAEERAPAGPRLPSLLAAAALVSLTAVGVWLAVERSTQRLDFPDTVRPLRMTLGLIPPQTEAARTPLSDARRQALLEIPVEREGVSLYWVSSLPEARPSSGRRSESVPSREAKAPVRRSSSG